MAATGIDPKVDYVFKQLCGVEDNALLLVDLLNAVLRFALGRLVTGVTLLNPFVAKGHAEGKVSVFDVRACDDPGRQFLLEMQKYVRPELDPDALPATLDVPVIRKAMEVLVRISQSELERQRYLDEERAERDAFSLVPDARAEGREEGHKEGRKEGLEQGVRIGRVQLLQRLLGLPEASPEELGRLPEGEFARLEESLLRQWGGAKQANGTPPAGPT